VKDVLGNEIEYNGELSFPGGLKDELPLGTIPAPIVQASVGVVFDTDLLSSVYSHNRNARQHI
jgi:hypothetical protein